MSITALSASNPGTRSKYQGKTENSNGQLEGSYCTVRANISCGIAHSPPFLRLAERRVIHSNPSHLSKLTKKIPLRLGMSRAISRLEASAGYLPERLRILQSGQGLEHKFAESCALRTNLTVEMIEVHTHRTFVLEPEEWVPSTRNGDTRFFRFSSLGREERNYFESVGRMAVDTDGTCDFCYWRIMSSIVVAWEGLGRQRGRWWSGLAGAAEETGRVLQISFRKACFTDVLFLG